VSPDYGSRGNGFSGQVKGVQLAIAEDAEGLDHLVSPEDAIRIAMARQEGPEDSESKLRRRHHLPLLPVCSNRSRHAAADRWIWQSRPLRIKSQDWIAPGDRLIVHLLTSPFIGLADSLRSTNRTRPAIIIYWVQI